MNKQNDIVKSAAKAETFKEKLLKAHTHRGEKLPEGKTIEVTAPERDFLRGKGVIATPTTTDAATLAAE